MATDRQAGLKFKAEKWLLRSETWLIVYFHHQLVKNMPQSSEMNGGGHKIAFTSTYIYIYMYIHTPGKVHMYI